MNYQISDLVIRIKNAALAKRKKIEVSYSRLNKEICELLCKKGFLQSVKEEDKEGKKVLLVELRYEQRRPIFTDVSIVSKPSLRIYTKAKSLSKKDRRRLGTAILSTSSGIMTREEARKAGVGGELLFEIW